MRFSFGMEQVELIHNLVDGFIPTCFRHLPGTVTLPILPRFHKALRMVVGLQTGETTGTQPTPVDRVERIATDRDCTIPHETYTGTATG